MGLLVAYSVRSLLGRWRATLLALAGVSLVVAVFMVVLSMSRGFETTLRATGRPDNAIVLQKAAPSELLSSIPLEHARRIAVSARVARDPDGEPAASPEIVELATLPRRSDGALTNVLIRGVTARAFAVRGGIRLNEGRAFVPGRHELVAGQRIARRIRGLEPGSVVRLQRRDWTVVGIFASEGSGFESELWGDFSTLAAAFPSSGSCHVLVVRLRDAADLAPLAREIEADPQMRLETHEERRYYEEQAKTTATALRGFAAFVALLTGSGAVVTLMNTMYALFAGRARELGTLRALGFPLHTLWSCLILESLALALLGGICGWLAASPLNGLTAVTSSSQLSELAFALRLSPDVGAAGIGLALAMGLLGGVWPALRVSRQPVVSALRAP